MDLACFASLDGYFEEVNRSFTKVLGFTTRELTGKKFLDFIHPEDVAGTLKEVEKLSLGIETLNFLNRYKSKSGPYVYIEWSAVFNRQTARIYATGRDITQKITANREFAIENEEKGKQANKLIAANAELDLQSKEMLKRAGELIIANKELAFQNREKGKRARELVIANKELAFQNKEKGKRAKELNIANKELELQYDKLLKIAFLQSHQVRVPVANILGLFNLFNFDNQSDPFNAEVLHKLKLVAESLDQTIYDITENTSSISEIMK